MSDDLSIASIVQTAVKAINDAAGLVGKAASGIDETQIEELRNAIDHLERRLNEKKREFADGAS